jgi:RNA-directed DNA polymerase
MNDHEKSHEPVVPTKLRNKAAKAGADGVEGRGATKGNLIGQNARRTQSRGSAPNALDRVREAARRDRKMKFTGLLHHITEERLTSVYGKLRKRAAAGVDGVVWKEYGEGLEEKIRVLHSRIHRGAYRPKPTRRTYIRKADGSQRPLGIATIEDKVVQGAVAEVLNAIYEEDFYGFCYGFRAGRSPHDALDALATALKRKRVNWVLDADIRSFFDSVGHEWVRKFLEHRIGDQRVVRLILKWLSAGVMEQGEWKATESGSPQGATISPLLANMYLFHAFDQWAHSWRNKEATGDVVIVRYADDFIVGFEHRRDAERFRLELGERLSKFELTLHPDKTRLIEFGRYAAERREKRGERTPESFSFLGFMHICASDRGGKFAVRRVTQQKRMSRKLHDIREELASRRHDPLPQQGQWLQSVIRGFDQYHGVPGNIDALNAFRRAVLRIWRQSLQRRSQNSRVTIARMVHLSERWFPKAKIVHPWPEQRFDAKTQGRNRMR